MWVRLEGRVFVQLEKSIPEKVYQNQASYTYKNGKSPTLTSQIYDKKSMSNQFCSIENSVRDV